MPGVRPCARCRELTEKLYGKWVCRSCHNRLSRERMRVSRAKRKLVPLESDEVSRRVERG